MLKSYFRLFICLLFLGFVAGCFGGSRGNGFKNNYPRIPVTFTGIGGSSLGNLRASGTASEDFGNAAIFINSYNNQFVDNLKYGIDKIFACYQTKAETLSHWTFPGALNVPLTYSDSDLPGYEKKISATYVDVWVKESDGVYEVVAPNTPGATPIPGGKPFFVLYLNETYSEWIFLAHWRMNMDGSEGDFYQMQYEETSEGQIHASSYQILKYRPEIHFFSGYYKIGFEVFKDSSLEKARMIYLYQDSGTQTAMDMKASFKLSTNNPTTAILFKGTDTPDTQDPFSPGCFLQGTGLVAGPVTEELEGYPSLTELEGFTEWSISLDNLLQKSYDVNNLVPDLGN